MACWGRSRARPGSSAICAARNPILGYENFRFRRAKRAGRRRLRAVARVVCRSAAIGAHHGTGRCRICRAAAIREPLQFARARRWAGSKPRAAAHFIGCGWTKMDESRATGLVRRPSPTGTAFTSPWRNSRSRIFRSCSPLSICPWPRTTGDVMGGNLKREIYEPMGHQRPSYGNKNDRVSGETGSGWRVCRPACRSAAIRPADQIASLIARCPTGVFSQADGDDRGCSPLHSLLSLRSRHRASGGLAADYEWATVREPPE